MEDNIIAKSNEQPTHRINGAIKAETLRLVGDNIEENNLVLSRRDALKMADEMGLDLVEISPDAKPPVCKIIDYQKFLYQMKKRLKDQKAKTQKSQVKEIRFGPQTDDHDFEFKYNHAVKFLSDGDKVRAYVFFRGRQILFKEQGEELLMKFASRLEEYGKLDQKPILEGKKMTILISPVKKK